jgi:hypothetical protein
MKSKITASCLDNKNHSLFAVVTLCLSATDNKLRTSGTMWHHVSQLLLLIAEKSKENWSVCLKWLSVC